MGRRVLLRMQNEIRIELRRGGPDRCSRPSGGGLTTELNAVTAAWASSDAFSEQTRLRTAETVARYAARLRRESTARFAEASPEQAAGFVRAATRSGSSPELATMHARRTALRALYRTLRQLGFADGDPTLDVHLPARGELAARPLTDDEVALARLSAYGHPAAWTPVRAVSWALAEATAVSSEIAAVRLAQLDEPEYPSTVALPGTRRHDARTAALTDWGRQVLARRAAQLRDAGASPHTLLAYGGAAQPGGAKAQAAVCNALRTVLRDAGLAGEPDVRPSSVRHWAGRALYDAGVPIHEVARALGHRSLDETASDIGLHWRTPAPATDTATDRAEARR